MKDLTKGSPIKLIIMFALPILLGNVLQQAYSIADTIIIGQFLNNQAIAAVGLSASVVSLMINIINGLVTGFAVVVAKNFGAKNMDEMRRTIARMAVFSSLAAAVLTVGVAVFINPILSALNTPPEIFGQARDYLMIITLGLMATLLYNFEAGILRAVGDSVVPLVILAISTVLNIGLDILMVRVINMGVAGAALATVLSQLISAVICLIYLVKRRKFLIVGKKDFVFTAKSSAELLSAGFGMALMFSIVDIGSIILQSGINDFGTDIITAHTAARKIFGLTIMPFSAVCATLVTYCSQNRGSGKYSRIRRGVRDSMIVMFTWATIAVALVFFAGNFLVGILVNSDDPNSGKIIETGVLYMKWAVPFYYFLAALLGLRSSLQGLGKSMVPIICSLIELSWKIVTVQLMIPLFGGKNGTVGGTIKEIGGYFGVVISEPIIWTVCAIFIGIVALVTFRRLPARDEEPSLVTDEADNNLQKLTGKSE